MYPDQQEKSSINLLGLYPIATKALISTLTFLCQVQIMAIDNFKLYLHHTGYIIATSYQQQICTIQDLEKFQEKNPGLRKISEQTHFIS